jgi:guanylate kinase
MTFGVPNKRAKPDMAFREGNLSREAEAASADSPSVNVKLTPEALHSGLIFALSAPSGTGKTTVAELVIKLTPNITRSVSLNTRQKRSNEVDGHDYTFVSRNEFDQNVKDGNLVEFAEVYGSLRGTPMRPLQLNQSKGIDTICIIEWNGAKQLKNIFGNVVVSIYLMPPSLEALKQRIIARAQDSVEEIARRMANVEQEIKFASAYDYCVINDDLTECASNVVSIIKAERCRVRN